MKQEQQGLQSTKASLPRQEPLSPDRTNDVIYSLVSSKDKAYMDLTGRFPYCSSRGNEYVLISYHYDANAIQGIPLPNRQAATITNGWLTLHNRYDNAGLAPKTWILDNETSRDLKTAMSKKKVDFQLVPPHNHRANAAERAIQTFKNHFKAGLASLDPNFPVSEWDRLLPQAFLTLNLLRASRVNPKLSAEAYLHGQFDFNATPLAPPGTMVAVHSKPGQRHTWDPNCKEGWYVGPALEHYRCVQCYMPATRSVVTSDTVLFLPHELPLPSVTIDDFLRQAATDIVSILTHPPPSTVPSLEAGDSTKNALLKLALLLNPSEDINDKIHQQHSIALATAKSMHRQSSSQSRQPSPSPSPPRHHPSRPITPPANRSLRPQPSLASTIPHPVLTLDQRQRLRDILTRTITAITNDRLKSVSKFPVPTQRPFSFRHRAATALWLITSFSPQCHIYITLKGKKQSLKALLCGPDKDIWSRSTSNEFGRLAQGNDFGIEGSDTIQFIAPHQAPTDRKVTYASFVCDYRPLKKEQYRVRFVVGGDNLSYDDDVGAPGASLLETKQLINNVIPDARKGARFLTCDIKDFFLLPSYRPESMKIHISNFPYDVIQRYNLNTLEDRGGYVFIQINMYGLKQAAVLAYDHLVQNLQNDG